MNYNSLKATINANVKQNGNQEITGIVMNSVLNAMVNALSSAGATFGGTITPTSSAPVSLDQATAFLAMSAGTYTNFRDSNNNPIVITCPSLIVYGGGDTLAFTTMSLPVPQVLSVAGGNSLVIPITDSKNSYRIDMTAQYTGGSEERYIGSLILEVNDLAMRVAHGYYYGDDMSEILSECAIWKDDPEIFPEEQGYYLLLTTQSDLDEVIFSVSSMDGQSVQMVESNEDEKIKVADATITPVGAGGDGKMGVISQTQTWSGSGSTRTYVMSNPVTGLIPQANIDLFESAGAVFNETTGYFELNGLTDISYEEMSAIYNFGQLPYALSNYLYQVRYIRTNLPTARITADSLSTFARDSSFEVVAFNPNADFRPAGTGGAYAFYSMQNVKRIIGVLNLSAITSGARFVEYSLLLGDFRFKSLKFSISLMSPFVTKDSLLYLINNEASTSAITITLEASVYAKCQSGGEWYSDISTALAAHTNVSLASA